MIPRAASLSLLVAVVVAGCGKDGSGPAGPLAGDWESSVPDVTVTLTLRHAGAVSGTGFITSPPNSATLAVSGSYSAPMANLAFNPDQAFQPFTFSGQLTTPDSLVGVFNGSGFSNFGVVFVRQP